MPPMGTTTREITVSIAIDGVIYKAAGSQTIARQANQKGINLTAELETATVSNLVTGELYYWFDYSTQRELKALQSDEAYTDGGVSVPEVFQLAGQPAARKKSIIVPLNFARVNVVDGSLTWFTNDDGTLKVYERTVKLIADRARDYFRSIAVLQRVLDTEVVDSDSGLSGTYVMFDTAMGTVGSITDAEAEVSTK